MKTHNIAREIEYGGTSGSHTYIERAVEHERGVLGDNEWSISLAPDQRLSQGGYFSYRSSSLLRGPVTPRPLFLPHLPRIPNLRPFFNAVTNLQMEDCEKNLRNYVFQVSSIRNPPSGRFHVSLFPLSMKIYFVYSITSRCSTMLKLGFTGDVVIRYWKESQCRL